MLDDPEAHLALLKTELAAARSKLVAREAALRAPLAVEEQAMASLRAEADELRGRIQAYEAEGAGLGAPRRSLFTLTPRIARTCLALLALFASALALPSHAPQAIVGIFAIFGGAIAWGLRND